ncbi:MAG: F0F1 ATP synthase subunit A [Candidatus Nanopelagicales bacterium]
MQTLTALAMPLVRGSLPVSLPMNEDGGSTFHAPSTNEFFPGQLFGEGTFWGPTRINLVGLLMTLLLVVFFVAAFRRPAVVPGKLQTLGEMAIGLVQTQVIDQILGKRGKPYVPLLVTMFWMILAFNIAGVTPLLHISATSVVGVPLLLAVISYLVFNIAGMREHGVGKYLAMNLVPPGLPKFVYLLVTPIEFVSTFVLRPITLTIRLLANMISGHLLLVLFFSATSYFLFSANGLMKAVAVPSFAMGFIFTLFEVLVAFLQALIFTLLTAIYINGAISHEH